MTTSQKQISEPTEGQLTCFPVGSHNDHASHSPQPASDLEQQITEAFGRKCLEQFGKFSRVSCWQKMFAGLLIGMEGWYSTRCRLTWKMKATKSFRFYFQLAPSELPTEGIGFGLLHTPAAQEPRVGVERLVTKTGEPAKIGERAYDKHTGRLAQVGLVQQVQMGLLKTPPRACEAVERRNMKTVVNKVENGGDVTLTTLAKYQGGNLLPTPAAVDWKQTTLCESQRERSTLPGVLVKQMLPTPATRDYKGGNSMEHLTRKPKAEGNSHQDQLANFIKLETGSSSQLNPRFVAEMMGYPPDYLELPFLSTETNP